MLVDTGREQHGWPDRGTLILSCALSVLLPAGDGVAAEMAKVRVRDGQTLRGIAQEYLGDPDLWTEILRANGLMSITDVRPGTELVIPAAEISAANRALRGALAKLQEATEQGARLFAAAEIEEGLRLYRAGVAERKASRWEEAERLAGEASLAAGEALRLAGLGRDATAEARLSDRAGWVEGRTPRDLVWSERALNAVLVEAEKVRTLSRSSAQITFRDDSRLRLSANSQAVIQRMRVDPLSRREEAKVSLVEGDLYALLNANGERRSFEVEVPEVRTEVESRNFWVGRDAGGAKFTNYDDGTVNVAANGATVSLGRNEGTVVRTGRAPSGKIGVLPAPELQAPDDDGEAFGGQAELTWQPLPDATGYWLELAHDPGFGRMAASRWGLKEGGFATGPLEIGAYYWRVAALDKFGLPGERSKARRFQVRVDQAPPYLAVREPAEQATVRAVPLRVRGESEPGVKVLLNGAAIAVGADGGFDAEIRPEPGDHALRLEAVDGAGNVTSRTRNFRYVPDERAALEFDTTMPQQAPGHFLTDRDVISLHGATDPQARLLVRSAAGELRATTYADADGRFALNLPLAVLSEDFTLELVQRTGFASTDRFTVSQDREPPAIVLDSPIPTVTAVEWLALRGRVEGGRSLSVNGRPAQLVDGAFDEKATLRQGQNAIELVATDAVGNVLVERFEVALDQEAPVLVGHQVTPASAASGEPLRIELMARDSSGLRKVAPVRIQVAGTEYADFLELSGGGSYGKTLLLPQEAVGRVTLKTVEVEDYAGNKARFTFDR